MRILVLSPIDSGAVERLTESHDVMLAYGEDRGDLERLVKDREVLIFRSGIEVDRRLMSGAPDLRLLIRAGSGCDNVDVAYVRSRGLTLHNVPEPGAQAVAEMAFALMLAVARNLARADQLLRQGRWAKHDLEGHVLRGKTLGIVGAGNIGARVGEMGALWGMKVLGCVGSPSADVASALSKSGIELVDLATLLSRSDFVSLHVPLKDSTRHLIDAEALGRVKRGAFLVNLARGGVVDEDALRHELQPGGRLRGAALDVHRHEGEGHISPLAALPNVLLTPHIGATTVDTQREIGRRVVDLVASFAASAPCRSVVPIPDVQYHRGAADAGRPDERRTWTLLSDRQGTP